MIQVTKLNGGAFYVNPYEIEFIEETPDTVISLKSGKKVLVAEDAQTVIGRMVDFYRIAGQVSRFIVREETGGDEDPPVCPRRFSAVHRAAGRLALLAPSAGLATETPRRRPRLAPCSAWRRLPRWRGRRAAGRCCLTPRPCCSSRAA